MKTLLLLLTLSIGLFAQTTTAPTLSAQEKAQSFVRSVEEAQQVAPDLSVLQ